MYSYHNNQQSVWASALYGTVLSLPIKGATICPFSSVHLSNQLLSRNCTQCVLWSTICREAMSRKSETNVFPPRGVVKSSAKQLNLTKTYRWPFASANVGQAVLWITHTIAAHMGKHILRESQSKRYGKACVTRGKNVKGERRRKAQHEAYLITMRHRKPPGSHSTHLWLLLIRHPFRRMSAYISASRCQVA